MSDIAGMAADNPFGDIASGLVHLSHRAGTACRTEGAEPHCGRLGRETRAGPAR